MHSVSAPVDLSLSTGVISGLRTGVEGAQLLQTTAAISAGSSGGPLIGMDGAVIGVTTFYLMEGQNLNFAIPSQEVVKLLEKNYQNLAEKFPDRDDPLSVAAAFYYALHEGDIEKAFTFVDPREQSEAEAALRSSPPTIPRDAVLALDVGHPIDGAPHSEVSIVGTDIGIDLVKYRDGWWVIK